MQCRVYPLLVTALFIVNPCLCQTPVIGGTCRLGTADVQIGGKQTQFFLKCEATSESAAGDGVWVVKSRAATTSATTPTVTISQPMSVVPLENTLPQQHPKLMRKQPNICEQDIDARESDSCAVSATCLQATHDIPSSYLQCDQTSLRWMRKSCQDGFVFNFEQQTCIVPKRMNSLSHVCPDGTVASGTCPCADGYVCTSQLLCCPLASSASSCPAPCSPNCPPNMACDSSTNCCRPLRRGRRFVLEPHGDKTSINGPPTAGAASTKAATFHSASPAMVSTSCDIPNTSCFGTADCPPTFICSNKCCRLDVCPNGAKVLFTCTNAYQCKAGESCLFGGCCNRKRLRTAEKLEKSKKNTPEVVTVDADLAVDQEPYFPRPSMNLSEESSAAPPTSTAAPVKLQKPVRGPHMPATAPTDACVVDSRVDDCSMANPCPEASECLSGQCCRFETKRCENGLPALAVPSSCVMSDDCPIDSVCEHGSCCPNDGSRTEESSVLRTNQETASNEKMVSNKPAEGVMRKVDSNSTPKKAKCLHAGSCSSRRPKCPPKHTCSLDGRCCRLDKVCPDGSVPEAMCGVFTMCADPNHVCTGLDERTSVCCAREIRKAVEPLCPLGSVEVGPRLGATCRYSIQCPAPYYCNGRGQCCQPIF